MLVVILSQEETVKELLLADLLRNRTQVVVADSGRVRSDALTTNMGVAQGSSVSNILFSILLNDLPGAIDSGETFMYADDVAVVVCAPTYEELESKLNLTAASVANWFSDNGLTLNTKKTHHINFDLSGRQTRSLAVSANGHTIDQVTSTTFLGFEFIFIFIFIYSLHSHVGTIMLVLITF
jgi:hypothetical protein